MKRTPMIHLAERVFNTPLMIHRPKLDAIMRVIGPRLNVDPKMFIYDEDEPIEKREEPAKPAGPVAVIPVYGSLVKRAGYMDALSGMTSYDALRSDITAAMNDPNVKTLLLDIDSPGGEAAGLFDFCEWLNSLTGTKPIIGISNDSAYSAAYAIASCVDKLFVTGVGGVGSIGVYALHVDQSKYDEQLGVTYTYVSSGDKKVDGNPHAPLSSDALAEMQAHVDKIRDMFVNLVAENRGVSVKRIYDTEAALYMGGDGIPMLADSLGSYDDAMNYAMKTAAKASRSIAIPGLPEGEQIKIDVDLKPHVGLSARWWSTNRKTAMEHLRGRDGFGPMLNQDVYIDNENKAGELHPSFMGMRAYGSVQLDKGIAEVDYIGRISGILAPYGKLSRDLGGFKEVYEAGCFKKSIENGDPMILAYHDPSKVLGRKSAGTAKFWEEADGLHYEANLPDTQDARDLKTLVERGDVRGASAAFFFVANGYRWEVRGGERVRVVEQAELVEGSPHSFAAYDDSSAEVEQAAAATHDELAGVRLRLLGLQKQF